MAAGVRRGLTALTGTTLVLSAFYACSRPLVARTMVCNVLL